MKKVILTLLLLGVAGVMPLQFAQTGGNLKPVAVLAPINEEKLKENRNDNSNIDENFGGR